MVERMPPIPPSEGRASIPTNMTLEQYKAHRLAQIAAAQGAQMRPPNPSQRVPGQPYSRPHQPFPVPQPSSQPPQQPMMRPPEAMTSKPEVLTPRKKLSETQRKVLVRSAVALTAVSLLGGSAYAGNILNIQEIFPIGGEDHVASNGLEQVPLETLGAKSLASPQCEDPNAVLLVATVEGRMPLVPLVSIGEKKGSTKVEPYMTEANKTALPADQQAAFESFTTDSGYPESTLENLPLALNVCEMPGISAVTESNGALTINRSAFQVKFRDPNGLFQTGIGIAYQTESADNVSVDAKKAQYLTLPDPRNKLFLGQNSDEAYNKSVTKLTDAMLTPGQLQSILYTMESKAVQELDNVVTKPENIVYPGNDIDTLQRAIDVALVQRIAGDDSMPITYIGNYDVEMDVPVDPKTKLPVPLVRLDATQQFQVEHIDVTFGSVKEPDPVAPVNPIPTPTPTNNQITSR